jgi:hypothetical protein
MEFSFSPEMLQEASVWAAQNKGKYHSYTTAYEEGKKYVLGKHDWYKNTYREGGKLIRKGT